MSDHDQHSHSDDASYSRAPKQRRRRPPLSCVECRRRKLKCNRLLPCNNCVRTKKSDQCAFTGPQPPKATPESMNQKSAPALRQKLPDTSQEPGAESYHMWVFDSKLDPKYRFLQNGSGENGINERSLEEAPSAENALNTPRSFRSDSARGASMAAERANVDDRVRNLPDCAFRGRNGRTRYFGRSNHTTTMSYFQGLGPFVAGGHMRQREKELREFKLHEMIPHRELTDELVRLYLNTFEPTYRTLHVPTFLESYSGFWMDPKSSKLDREFVAQLLGVIAAGSSFYASSLDRHDREEMQKMATSWIIEAQTHITCNFVNPDLDLRRIQTQCILLIARLGIAGDDDESQDWVASGLLIRSAMSIGLHRDPSRFHKENQKCLQPEIRRRLWFTIVELDLIISIHRGFCPSVDFNECDCEPPSDKSNERDMIADTIKSNRFLDGITLPSNVYQTLLIRSLMLRVETAKKVNALKFELTYEDVLRMSEEMIQSIQLSSSIFENITPKKNTSADSAESYQHQFAQSLHLFTMRKFLLSLHRPFSSSAVQLPKYSYSRKITLELSLDVLSQRGFSDNEMVYPHITQLGNSMFHKEVYHSAMSVCVELSIQAREKATGNLLDGSGSGFLTSMIQSQQSVMVNAVEQTLHDSGRRIGAGGKGCKFYFFLALIVCFVKSQLDGKDPLPRVEAASRQASQVCRAVINGQSYSDALASYSPMQVNDIHIETDPKTISRPPEDSETTPFSAADFMDLTSFDLVDWFGGLNNNIEMWDPELFNSLSAA